eukprot:TRINITY_DN880_c0_g2_i1.p1 TRINITY_DN880_c0_g2~~TRINITY_DN880_c0_g2_i1.p1  ORF type:complete len:1859 (-),score=523.87 TRINITY_DN880_c0_g2_i1:721-6297(-)
MLGSGLKHRKAPRRAFPRFGGGGWLSFGTFITIGITVLTVTILGHDFLFPDSRVNRSLEGTEKQRDRSPGVDGSGKTANHLTGAGQGSGADLNDDGSDSTSAETLDEVKDSRDDPASGTEVQGGTAKAMEAEEAVGRLQEQQDERIQQQQKQQQRSQQLQQLQREQQQQQEQQQKQQEGAEQQQEQQQQQLQQLQQQGQEEQQEQQQEQKDKMEDESQQDQFQHQQQHLQQEGDDEQEQHRLSQQQTRDRTALQNGDQSDGSAISQKQSALDEEESQESDRSETESAENAGSKISQTASRKDNTGASYQEDDQEGERAEPNEEVGETSKSEEKAQNGHLEEADDANSFAVGKTRANSQLTGVRRSNDEEDADESGGKGDQSHGDESSERGVRGERREGRSARGEEAEGAQKRDEAGAEGEEKEYADAEMLRQSLQGEGAIRLGGGGRGGANEIGMEERATGQQERSDDATRGEDEGANQKAADADVAEGKEGEDDQTDREERGGTKEVLNEAMRREGIRGEDAAKRVSDEVADAEDELADATSGQRISERGQETGGRVEGGEREGGDRDGGDEDAKRNTGKEGDERANTNGELARRRDSEGVEGERGEGGEERQSERFGQEGRSERAISDRIATRGEDRGEGRESRGDDEEGEDGRKERRVGSGSAEEAGRSGRLRAEENDEEDEKEEKAERETKNGASDGMDARAERTNGRSWSEERLKRANEKRDMSGAAGASSETEDGREEASQLATWQGGAREQSEKAGDRPRTTFAEEEPSSTQNNRASLNKEAASLEDEEDTNERPREVRNTVVEKDGALSSDSETAKQNGGDLSEGSETGEGTARQETESETDVAKRLPFLETDNSLRDAALDGEIRDRGLEISSRRLGEALYGKENLRQNPSLGLPQAVRKVVAADEEASEADSSEQGDAAERRSTLEGEEDSAVKGTQTSKVTSLQDLEQGGESGEEKEDEKETEGGASTAVDVDRREMSELEGGDETTAAKETATEDAVSDSAVSGSAGLYTGVSEKTVSDRSALETGQGEDSDVDAPSKRDGEVTTSENESETEFAGDADSKSLGSEGESAQNKSQARNIEALRDSSLDVQDAIGRIEQGTAGAEQVEESGGTKSSTLVTASPPPARRSSLLSSLFGFAGRGTASTAQPVNTAGDRDADSATQSETSERSTSGTTITSQDGVSGEALQQPVSIVGSVERTLELGDPELGGQVDDVKLVLKTNDPVVEGADDGETSGKATSTALELGDEKQVDKLGKGEKRGTEEEDEEDGLSQQLRAFLEKQQKALLDDTVIKASSGSAAGESGSATSSSASSSSLTSSLTSASKISLTGGSGEGSSSEAPLSKEEKARRKAERLERKRLKKLKKMRKLGLMGSDEGATSQEQQQAMGLDGSVDLLGDPVESTTLGAGHRGSKRGDLKDGDGTEGGARRDKSGKSHKKKSKVPGPPCALDFKLTAKGLEPPPYNPKFASFPLRYIASEDPAHPEGGPASSTPASAFSASWTPRFAGHQSLKMRESGFRMREQRIHCGFVSGPDAAKSTGFDVSEDDKMYMNQCQLVVASAVFGDCDRIRSPSKTKVSSWSRKRVCFVMFVDQQTLDAFPADNVVLDGDNKLGLWKVVLVKSMPYSDPRRTGKIPKLLPHRLFPNALYSMWVDSKLRLAWDPILIWEKYLWREGYEYAISQHYDRTCVWQEVARNKFLNKYNHTVIDEQFEFYKADGLQPFNGDDPKKLLPSNVPEGSFIVRAHTPAANLFSCAWFNEVDRFTSRDQISFFYTYMKIHRSNKAPFYLNMFPDCERKLLVKLFKHKFEEAPVEPDKDEKPQTEKERVEAEAEIMQLAAEAASKNGDDDI